jgi:hypothetical protein
MSYAFHGKYCGPGWSAGEYQDSVDLPNIEPIDILDSTCQTHDRDYAIDADLINADFNFATDMLNHTVELAADGSLIGASKAAIMGAAVGAQGMGRYALSALYKNSMKKQATSLRGSTSKSIAANNTVNRKRKRNEIVNSRRNVTDMSSITAPVSVSTTVARFKPKVSSSNGNTIVSNKEYIGYVVGSTGFSLLNYPINPGLSNIFSWLQNAANNYDRYRWRKLRFTYIQACSSASAGRIALVFNYDAADSPPNTKLGALSVNPAVEVSIWQPCVLNVRTTNQILYTRNTLISNTDIKTYDMGQLYIVTDLCANGNTIGEFYVDYEIELFEPHAQIPPTVEIYSTSATKTGAFPVGCVTVGSNIVADTSFANTLQIGASGRYMIYYTMVGTGLTTSTLTFGSAGNSSIVAVSGASINTTANGPGTAAAGMFAADVTVDPSTQYCQIIFTFTCTTLTKIYIFFSKVDSGMVPAISST